MKLVRFFALVPFVVASFLPTSVALAEASPPASTPSTAPNAVNAQGLPKRTLPELIALARKNSIVVASAESQVPIREAQRREAIDNWFPSGEINFLFTGVPRSQCQVPPGEQSTLDAISDAGAKATFRQQNCVNTVNPDNMQNISFIDPRSIKGPAGEINIRVIQPLYTFGKIEHGTRAAERGIEAEKQKVEIARNDIELKVSRAYWGLKAARTALVTAGEARDEIAGWVKKIEDDLDRDKPQYNFNINDLQRLKVALSTLDIGIADLERNIGIAERGLPLAIGEPTDIDDAELDVVEIVDHPIEYFEGLAKHNRPELGALDAGVLAFRELQKLRFSEMLPDIGFVAGLTYRFAPSIEDSSNAFVTHANVFGFGAYLTLRQPLDLVEKHARYVHARADADALATQRRLAMTGIGVEIAEAYFNLNEARKRLEAVDRAQHVAQGWLSAVRQNIDLGTAEARDLVDAARAYYDLRFRFFQSIFDVNYQVAVLRKAAGIRVAK